MWGIPIDAELIYIRGPLLVLIIVGLVTLVFIYRAIRYLDVEKDALNLCKDKIKFLKNKNNGQEDAYKTLKEHALSMNNNMSTSADVQWYLYTTQKIVKQEEESGFVSDRLFAILQSVNTENLVRKTPHINDLHELTMQRERGSQNTRMFRTLSPSILVLGILGTLFGVDDKLDVVCDGGGIASLADALITGAGAVFFTVIIILLRGMYNQRLSNFVADFDEYTLKELLVFFQPESQDSTDVVKLNYTLASLVASKEKINDILNKVNTFQDLVNERKSEFSELLIKTQGNIKMLADSFAQAASNHCGVKGIRQKTICLAEEQMKLRKQYAESFSVLRGKLDGAVDAFSRVYDLLYKKGNVSIAKIANLSSDINHLDSIVQTLEVYKEKRFSLPSSERVKDELSILKKINKYVESLPQQMGLFKANSSFINESDAYIDAVIAEMSYLRKSVEELSRFQNDLFKSVQHDCDELSNSLHLLYQEKLTAEIEQNSFKFIQLFDDKKGLSLNRIKRATKCFKVKMLRFRSFYKSYVGMIVMTSFVVCLIVWHFFVRG